MLVLGISSSTPKHSVAVWEDGQILAEVFVGVPFRHAEYLPKALSEVLQYSERNPASIDAVAVDIGPGLYTGLRAGIAVAKTISMALFKPTIPVPSLWALAYEGSRVLGERVIAVSDARRKELFWQIFPPSVQDLAGTLADYVSGLGGSDSEKTLGIRLGSAEELWADLSELGSSLREYAILGEGALVLRDRTLGGSAEAGDEDVLSSLSALRVIEGFENPSASGVTEVAVRLANVEPRLASPPENVRAIYMRGADAKRTAERQSHAPVPSEVFVE